MQETGRAGRDNIAPQAILYYVSHPSNRFLEEPIKNYCSNKSTCRCQLLLQEFDILGIMIVMGPVVAVMFVNLCAHAHLVVNFLGIYSLIIHRLMLCH